MKTFFVMIILFHYGSIQAANTSSIPSNCVEKAKSFVIRGEWSQIIPGARLWDIDKIYKSYRSSSADACLDVTWAQAKFESQEYWRVRGKKHGCIVDDKIQDTSNDLCTEKELSSVKSNLGYVTWSEKAISLAQENCKTNFQRNIADISDVVANSPKEDVTDEASIWSEFSLTAQTAQSLLASDKCANIDPKLRSEPSKGWINKAALPCNPLDLGKGIFSAIKTNISGLWELLKGVWGVASGGPEYEALRSAVVGTIGPLLIQYSVDPDAATAALGNKLAALAQPFYELAVQKWGDFQCYSPAIQRDLVCKAISNIEGEVALTFVGAGFMNLMKAGKFPAMAGEIGTAFDKAAETLKLDKALGAVTRTAAYANLVRVSVSMSGAQWVREARTGLKMLVENGRVYVQQANEVFEVVSSDLRNQVIEQWNAFQQTAREVGPNVREKLGRAKQALRESALPRTKTISAGVRAEEVAARKTMYNETFKDIKGYATRSEYKINNVDLTSFGRGRVFQTMDMRSIAEAEHRIFTNVSVRELPKGHTYTYVVLEDGERVFGLVDNAMEVGVKHFQLANGRKVVAAGELKVVETGGAVNIRSGSFMRDIQRANPRIKPETMLSRIEKLFSDELGMPLMQKTSDIDVKVPVSRNLFKEFCKLASFSIANPHLCLP